ncbi:hybrid sensor histidine kinase/response regulator [Granulosicoccus sp. 3-233]|uniref:hybrid sensor histidine kinase/response regulator n=1 Tax=Granulosicoccus sp. 3-233 TaxID=3417969 RepID=UPI003D32B921
MTIQRVPQQIFPIRRKYNGWVADESMEDYALRYTARSVRKFSIWRVGNTAFGAASFLALEAIGAAMVLGYGFVNTVWAIAVVAIIIFLTGLPISYYAARHGLDMDLLTRGAGFGYLGSTISSLVYASFTIIFFAFEAAILATALQMLIPLPLWLWYVISSLIIVPLVARGISLISRIQLWSQIPWLLLLVLPYLIILLTEPQHYSAFTRFSGAESDSGGFEPLQFAAAAAIAFALIVQIGEQVDFLRFLPEKTESNSGRWWAAVILAGPGWIIPGALKILGGAFLAFMLLEAGGSIEEAMEPTRLYLAAFSHVFSNTDLVLLATLTFVVVSQIKINIVNAYAGSLAWSNFFARLTYSHPGRVVWLVFNCLIAVLIITLGIFESLEHVLSLYSIIAVAWIGTLVADLVINKPLGLSPSGIEFKRAHLHDFNPVGIGSMIISAIIAAVAQLGIWGDVAQAFAPFIALGSTFVMTPLLALLTHSRFYIARQEEAVVPRGAILHCSVCDNSFESDDMVQCPAYGSWICSLCCTLESRCHDMCKSHPPPSRWVQRMFGVLLPNTSANLVHRRVGSYLVVLLSQCTIFGAVLGLVYLQAESRPLTSDQHVLISGLFVEMAVLLLIVAAISSWWTVLGKEGRRMAQYELNRQNELLTQESEAHRLTDAALQRAKERAEQANEAKTRYVAGISHELRSPLNGILGYSQILLHDSSLGESQRQAVDTIRKSGEHQLDLINELLDLARIEADRVRLEPASLHLPVFFEEILQMIRPLAQEKNLRLEHLDSTETPDFILADAKRLRQILINLLTNAVRFTDTGTVTLDTGTRDDRLVLRVIDSGIGISQHDQERIFQPFERGAAGRILGEPGAGLGLAITEKLIHLMDGQLHLSSELKGGSVFEVCLPLVLSDTCTTEEESEPEIMAYSGPARTLLIVDDQAVQRQMLTALLSPLGFTIKEAAGGQECLDQLQEPLPDAILLDLSMGEPDGWETARQIRERGFNTLPIIIVSADVLGDHEARMASIDASAFVAKPVLESELRAALKSEIGLEWIHRSAPLTPTVGRTPPGTTHDFTFDDRARQALLHQARAGNVRALQHLLDELEDEDSTLTPSCNTARRWLQNFELDRLEDALMRADNELE